MAAPLEVAIHNPIRRRLLGELLNGRLLTLKQLAAPLGLADPAASYHLGVLVNTDAVTRSRTKSRGRVTYEANVDALPVWVRERVEDDGKTKSR